MLNLNAATIFLISSASLEFLGIILKVYWNDLLSTPLNASCILSAITSALPISTASLVPLIPIPSSKSAPINSAFFCNPSVTIGITLLYVSDRPAPAVISPIACPTAPANALISVSLYFAPYVTWTCAGIYNAIAVSNLFLDGIVTLTLFSIAFLIAFVWSVSSSFAFVFLSLLPVLFEI